jgi:hypothetical protein
VFWLVTGATAVVLGALAAQGFYLAAFTVAGLATLGLVICLPAPTLVGVFVAAAILAGAGRRAIESATGQVDSGLVVFVVLAVMTAVAGATAVRRWQGRPLDTVDVCVAVLCGLALLGAFNPLAGEVASGVVGLPIALAPLVWYWVGRAVLRPVHFVRLGWLVGALAALVAAYGLFQAYGWFTPFDEAWASGSELSSISIGGELRSFGTLGSPAEYSRLLTVGFLVLLVLPGRRLASGLVRFGALTLIGWALFVSGVRSAVVMTVLGALLLVLNRSVERRAKAVVLIGIVVAGALLVTAPLIEVRARDEPDNAAAVATSRQISGLRDPFDEDESSATSRIDVSVRGVRSAVSHPLGYGTATVTRAANRLGGVSLGGEGDVVRIAVAWGLAGLLAFGVAVVALGRRLVVTQRRGDATMGGLALAVLAGAALQWFNPGFYAVSPLAWLFAGGLVTAYVASTRTGEPREGTAAEAGSAGAPG